MAPALQLFPLGYVALAARPWRFRGRHFVTVIVKATFDLANQGIMTLAPPAPIATSERAPGGDPGSSALRSNDDALVVPRPEVLVVGSAYAGRGRRASTATVRLRLERDGKPLLDKSLEVVGDRRAKPGATAPEPAPFERMPLVYERALGGPSSADNPVGCGLEVEADGELRLPNVLLPGGAGVPPAGLGAIPRAWPARVALRGSATCDLPPPGDASGVVELPADLDEAYFQASPADQRVSELRGGELITLVGLHPKHETLRSYLPSLRGVALLQTESGQRIPAALRIDTLHLEPDVMRAEIVYRAAVMVGEEQLRGLRVAGALELAGRPVTFPDLATLGAARAAVTPAPEPATPPSHVATLVLEPAAQGGGARPTSGTMTLDEADSSRSRTLPFEPVTPGPASPRRQATILVEPDAAPASLPFARGRTERARRPAGAPSKRATPWAESEPSPPAIAAKGGMATLQVEEPRAAVASPAPPPAPPAPIEEQPPKPDRARARWRQDPAASAEAAPAKPVVHLRTDVKATVYKKPKR